MEPFGFMFCCEVYPMSNLGGVRPFLIEAACSFCIHGCLLVFSPIKRGSAPERRLGISYDRHARNTFDQGSRFKTEEKTRHSSWQMRMGLEVVSRLAWAHWKNVYKKNR